MGKEHLSTGGPVLITANHPNSFLDAIVIGSVFSRPVHFLARGDAFRKPWHNSILRLLHMIPVYRLSEGKENLHLNEHAFTRSSEILSQNGIVLIFIEGICVQQHELQPFKKGAARIAFENRKLPTLKILPLGIAYDSFTRFGKTINIQVANTLSTTQLFPFEEEAKNRKNFNTVLFEKIDRLIHVPPTAIRTTTKKYFLFLPAMVGYALHYFFYTIIKKFIKKKTRGTVFYDSVLFGALLFLYPLYVVFLCLILWMFHFPVVIILAIFFAFPVFSWCAVQWRRGL
jgi:1-acyl-sn-glycerol-3-phosphate acyltransferase